MIITEAERTRILSMHESFVPKRYREKTNSSSIPNLINQFIDELSFQKQVHLHSLSIIESHKRADYIKEYQNKYVAGLFSHNQVISETYLGNFKNVITESEISYSDQLDKFNNFLVKSLLFDNGIISEQWWNPTEYIGNVVNTVSDAASSAYNSAAQTVGAAWDKTKQVAGQAWDATKQAGQYVVDKLASAVDYIKKNGIGYVMETIRAALFSNVGTAVQFILAITGKGAIPVTIIWGIMGLYDLYQLTVNGDMSYLGNFIIDLICCVTAGYLAKPLSSFAGKMFSKVDDLMAAIMKSPAGPYVNKVITGIEMGLESVMKFFGEAATFMKNSMGIGWVSNLISKVKPFYTKIVDFFKSLRIPGRTRLATMQARSGLKKLTSLLAPGIIRTSAALSRKFSPEVFARVASLSEREIGEFIGLQVERTALATISKEAKSRFKEKPTEDFLRWVDSNFGTAYGDLYLTYLNGKKMFKYNADGKYTKIDELGANAIRGELDYVGAKGAKIQQGTAGLVGNYGF